MQLRRNSIDALIAVSISVVSAFVLLGTSHDYAMVFDEAFTVDREITLAHWFSGILTPARDSNRSDFFTREMIETYWRFSREEPDGHPPFYALLGLAGYWLSRRWVDPLTSYRLGPIALNAATAGLVFLFLARRRGRLAGLTAALAFMLLPRTFAHAHYAHYDMPVTCLWLLTQAAFLKSLRLVRWIGPFGVLLGLAAGTKLTGWFALVPPLVWWTIHEGFPIARRLIQNVAFDGQTRAIAKSSPLKLPATLALALGIPLAALTLYAIQPAWWSAPILGFERFLASNLSREKTVPVTSLYLGAIYRFALPWHNTLVLTAVTTPVFVVVLGVLGIGTTVCRARSTPEELIWCLSWSVLMIVRALPNVPGHDVERLILPSLASLSVLAGFGVGFLADQFTRLRFAFVASAVAILAIGECIVGISQTYPYNLSYYNFAVGGLRGAEQLGFEETYYWETLGPEFLIWVRQQSLLEPLELRFPLGLMNIILFAPLGHLSRERKGRRP